MGQDVDVPPSISIHEYELEAVHEFAYQGSTIMDSLSIETELNKLIGKAATTLSMLTKRVWTNSKLTEHKKIQVYKACVVSTLLYGSESWTLRSRQERRLNSFHMRCLRRSLGISRGETRWQTTKCSKEQASLKQRRMRWLGHICRMEDGCIPKDLYSELLTGKRPTGHPQLQYKDICNCDLKALGINTNTWEAAAADRSTWKQEVKVGLSPLKRTWHSRQRRKGHAGRHSSTLTDPRPPSPAESVTENVTPASVYLASLDDAETDEWLL